VGRGKPAPDIFLETARRLGLLPGHCVVVEDSRNGVLAARAAGMASVAVPCASTARQDFSAATAHLSDLLALPAWLESNRRRREKEWKDRQSESRNQGCLDSGVT
jgi:beta-phosphoglucomutase-like phosphatase (HAD superfamily)